MERGSSLVYMYATTCMSMIFDFLEMEQYENLKKRAEDRHE